MSRDQPERSKAMTVGAIAALALLPLALACAYPLFEAEVDDAQPNAISDTVDEFTAAVEANQPEAAKPEPPTPEPEPPEPEPPPPPPTPEEISAMLDAAAAELIALDIKIDPRRKARGPLAAGSGLRAAHDEDRALVLEGRFEQIRQWTALAKFGSREPGAHHGSSALSRYDLVVARDARARKDLAYLHIVVPPEGLAADGESGAHEAWIGDERWVNLTDSLEPARDYLPFKTNGTESLHRQWARADVIEALVGIAGDYHQRSGVPLGIGDLSHVTGGKIEDHWTHQHGVDVDLYLLDPDHSDDDGRPLVWWSHVKRGVPMWTREPKGKGEREPSIDAADEGSVTATSQRLELLAQVVLLVDEVAYFVHNDPAVLDHFDTEAGARRPGRRFLHANNRGYWPAHADHVHLRWVEGDLPVDVTPRP